MSAGASVCLGLAIEEFLEKRDSRRQGTAVFLKRAGSRLLTYTNISRAAIPHPQPMDTDLDDSSVRNYRYLVWAGSLKKQDGWKK